MSMPPQGIGDFKYKWTEVLNPTNGQILVEDSPNRVLIAFGASTSGILVAPYINNSQTVGWPVATTFLPLLLIWKDHGGIVTLAWKCLSAVPGTVSIAEMFYDPQQRR